MKRRDFLKTSSIGSLVLLAPAHQFSNSLFFSTAVSGTANGANWKLNDDGSFDLITPTVSLSGCYPVIDAQSVKALSVSVLRSSEGGAVIYKLAQGNLVLRFGKTEASLSLQATLEGFARSPHWLMPLGQGKILGAQKYFKQGFGFGGPSGWLDFPKPDLKQENSNLNRLYDGNWSVDSHLTTALLGEEEYLLATTTFEFDRFLQRSRIYNRQTRYGLIDRHLYENDFFFEAGFACERIAAGDEMHLPALHFTYGKGALETMQHTARLIAAANKVKLDKTARYYWCSWYEFESRHTIQQLEELIAGLKSIKPPLAIQTLQIDDGYCFRGDWLNSNERWQPGGIERAATLITQAGYQAGVWIAPFMVSSKSELYRDHPDWLLRNTEGEIIVEAKGDAEDTLVLDSSHPEAFEYLRKVFRTMRQRGITTFKTDFLDWGMRDSLRVKRYTPGKTSFEYYNEVMRMIRQEIGPESYWLGCIAPFQPLVGLIDGIRVSNDVGSGWSPSGAGNMIQEMTACQYFNNILWQNDPDVFYLRDENQAYTDDQKLTLALFNGFMGGVINTSDRFHTLSEEKIRLLRFLQPAPEKQSAFLPFWTETRQETVTLVRKYPHLNAWGILVSNASGSPQQKALDIKQLTGIQKLWCFGWGPGIANPLGEKSALELSLRPYESQLYFATIRNQPPDADMTLGGIRVKGL